MHAPGQMFPSVASPKNLISLLGGWGWSGGVCLPLGAAAAWLQPLRSALSAQDLRSPKRQQAVGWRRSSLELWFLDLISRGLTDIPLLACASIEIHHCFRRAANPRNFRSGGKRNSGIMNMFISFKIFSSFKSEIQLKPYSGSTRLLLEHL